MFFFLNYQDDNLICHLMMMMMVMILMLLMINAMITSPWCMYGGGNFIYDSFVMMMIPGLVWYTSVCVCLYPQPLNHIIIQQKSMVDFFFVGNIFSMMMMMMIICTYTHTLSKSKVSICTSRIDIFFPFSMLKSLSVFSMFFQFEQINNNNTLLSIWNIWPEKFFSTELHYHHHI